MKRTQWNIVDKNKTVIEGGFFDKEIAKETQEKDYPDCKVVKA